MIDRYTITATADAVRERFSVDLPSFYAPSYNARPTKLLPVITSNAPAGVSQFYWGTSPEWANNKTLSEKIVNVRAESIAEKPALKRALTKTRCIVPADGFYAWKRSGKKSFIPFRFVAKDQDLFSFAGLWEEYEDTDGNSFHTFTLLTTTANDLVAQVYERMPVLLDPQTESVWLNKDSSEPDLMQVLKPYASERMNYYSVSPRIGDNAVDVPSLILPTPPADQHGNLTLFD